VKVKKITWLNTKTRGQKNRRELDQILLKDSQTGLYNEEYFNEFLALEKKRCERSEDPAYLMLADLSAFTDVSERLNIAQSMMGVFSEVTRDTDIKGWHVDGSVIGIMFTEMTGKEATSLPALRRIANKCLWLLETNLGVETFSCIQISWKSLQNGHILEIHQANKS
jgi:hypothetical protein